MPDDVFVVALRGDPTYDWKRNEWLDAAAGASKVLTHYGACRAFGSMGCWGCEELTEALAPNATKRNPYPNGEEDPNDG